MKKQYFVYILTGHARTLYIGVTNNLERRYWKHRAGESKFTRRYRVKQLVYFEDYGEVIDAIAREKQLKSWRRSKKLALIDSFNPEWRDLGAHRGTI